MSKKILITNFSALTVMQVVQYLAPLIVLPYLVRVIGPAKFGIVSFAHAIAYYFTLLPDIGTNLYAPREIALIKDNKEELSEFVTGILVLKSLMLVITLFFYFVLITSIPRFYSEVLVFIFSAGYIIGESFIPVWFFQGVEKMVNITIGIFIIRVLALIAIFIFIQQPGDYVYVPLLNSVALIIGVIFMYTLIFFREGIRFRTPNKRLLNKIIREASPLFASNLVRNLYAGINIVVLGFLTTNTIVGYYAAAERLIKAGTGLLTQLSNVFYPYSSRLLKVSRDIGVASMRMGFVVGMLLSVPLTIFVITYADVIVHIMLGNEFYRSILLLRILAILLLATGLSNMFGIQILLPLGKRKMYMRPIIGGFILHLVLLAVVAPLFYEVGAALVYVIAQIAVVLWMGIEVKILGVGVLRRPVGLRLIGLTVGLSVFAGFSSIMGFNAFMSIGLFCVLLICLTIILGLFNIKTLSVNS